MKSLSNFKKDFEPLNLVFLLKQPLTSRDVERFGIMSALSRGHRSVILDLHPLIFPKLTQNVVDFLPPSDVDLIIVKTWSQLKACHSLIANADLVISIIRSYGLCARSYKVFRFLQRAKSPYLAIAPLVDPAYVNRSLMRPFHQRMLIAIERFNIDHILASIFSRVPFSLLRIPQAHYMVYNGTASEARNQLVGDQTIPINAHAYDFDIAERAKAEKLDVKSQAVFLDQDLPFHPDTIAADIKPLDQGRYYSELADLFAMVEANLGLEVVIAVHPRANKSRAKKIFGKRRTVFNDTARTVAESRLAFTHYSRSSNFAVLLKKPLILVGSQQLYDWCPWLCDYMVNLGGALGKAPYFFDASTNLSFTDAFDVDTDSYLNYIERFIKSPGSLDRPKWDIVYDQIEAELIKQDQTRPL